MGERVRPRFDIARNVPNPGMMDVSRDGRSWLATLQRRVMPAPKPRWPGLSPVARRVERVVHLLDSAIVVPGTRFRVGLDPLMGLFLPAVGDAVGGFVSLGMLFLAVQYRVPAPVIVRMVLNIGVDSAIGAVPIVGDVFDFGWKANERNFELLANHRGDVPHRSAPITYWLSVIGLLVAALVLVAAPIALVIWLLLQPGVGLSELFQKLE